jgi:signal transduction histidine kinase
MRQVFTLWPTDGPEKPQRQLAEDGFPAWSRLSGPRKQRLRWTLRESLLLAAVGLPVLALTVLTPGPLTATGILICLPVVAFQALAIGISCKRLWTVEGQLSEALRWNAILFQRSGVSLWREDWSAARDQVLRLLDSGVTDIQSYFASRPDELRDIRRSVIVKDVNDHAVQRAGAAKKDQLLGSLEALLPDTDHTFVQWLIAFAEGDTFYRSETHITMPDGKEVDVLFFAGLPANMKDFEDILVSDIDISEYKATQARLLRAQQDLARASRISTIGALTASIAHEVNSSLAAIVSSSEAALRWLSRKTPDMAEAQVALQNTLSAATRAMTVVERTRAFLSNEPATVSRNDIATIVQDSVLLTDRELRRHGVAVHIDVPDGLPPVVADAINIQQVIVNLMMNAAQAMSGQTRARDLAISARQEGDRVLVAISDEGPGIPEDDLPRIFQPFYSTRQGGMGMGLAICKSCIEAHGGRISAFNKADGGAVFQFDLPAAIGADQPEANSHPTNG